MPVLTRPGISLNLGTPCTNREENNAFLCILSGIVQRNMSNRISYGLNSKVQPCVAITVVKAIVYLYRQMSCSVAYNIIETP